MNPNMRVLTLTAYGEKPEEDLRVTLSAMCIKATLAKDEIVQNRSVKRTTILFIDDSEPIVLCLNEIDLMQLESIVGCYSFGLD